MGNSPSDEPVDGDQSGGILPASPSGLPDSDQDIAYQEIVTPPSAEATGRDVIFPPANF